MIVKLLAIAMGNFEKVNNLYGDMIYVIKEYSLGHEKSYDHVHMYRWYCDVSYLIGCVN